MTAHDYCLNTCEKHLSIQQTDYTNKSQRINLLKESLAKRLMLNSSVRRR